jgi:transposase
MPDEQSSSSVGARKRALGKILRDVSIKRRETYFDLLVSGYSVEQIASSTKKSPATVRRVVGQALAKRRLDAPEDYARIQIARLTKALRCADESLEEGDVRAIAPFLKVVRELSLYNGVNVGSRPSYSRKLRPHRRRLRSRTPSASWLRRRTKTKKLHKSALKPLKSFGRVTWCESGSRRCEFACAPTIPSIRLD